MLCRCAGRAWWARGDGRGMAFTARTAKVILGHSVLIKIVVFEAWRSNVHPEPSARSFVRESACSGFTSLLPDDTFHVYCQPVLWPSQFASRHRCPRAHHDQRLRLEWQVYNEERNDQLETAATACRSSAAWQAAPAPPPLHAAPTSARVCASPTASLPSHCTPPPRIVVARTRGHGGRAPRRLAGSTPACSDRHAHPRGGNSPPPSLRASSAGSGGGVDVGGAAVRPRALTARLGGVHVLAPTAAPPA